jgi:DNA-directed RNA polymerase specialized sigma24 family protein
MRAQDRLTTPGGAPARPGTSARGTGLEVTAVDGTIPFPEEDVRGLLAGTDEEIGRALALIDRHLRRRLCGWLRRRFPGLASDDLANAWAETLVGAWEAARARRFDPGRPLVPWLCHIANARAVDYTRRATTRAEALAAVAVALRASQAGRQWQLLGEGERAEVLQLIRAAIDQLPDQQRRVLDVFVAHYPETRSMTALQREVSRMSGRAETLAAVKRALQEGRRKVRAFLRTKGYAVEKRGNP